VKTRQERKKHELQDNYFSCSTFPLRQCIVWIALRIKFSQSK
jgi:hypothetical protein